MFELDLHAPPGGCASRALNTQGATGAPPEPERDDERARNETDADARDETDADARREDRRVPPVLFRRHGSNRARISTDHPSPTDPASPTRSERPSALGASALCARPLPLGVEVPPWDGRQEIECSFAAVYLGAGRGG
mgnify:CR=1 FL=1